MGSLLSTNESVEEESSPSQSGFESQCELQSAGNVTIVKDILKSTIRIDEEERKRSFAITLQFVHEYVRLACQKDKLFEAIFSRIYPTGSSFEGLRIVDPYEYDIDLVMRVSYKNLLQMLYLEDSPCYAMCAIIENDMQYSDPNIQNVYCLIKKHLVETNGIYLLPNLVLSWMQSVTDKILPLLKNFFIPDVTSIWFSASGPARTANIFTNFSENPISVDLVPVLEFRPPNSPNGVDLVDITTRHNIDIQNQFWFIVPKPYTYNDVSNEIARKMWRIHFPEIEKAIIHDRGCIKPVIKMLKLVRDTKNVDVLCSYYIKTIVMDEVINHPESDWNEKFMDERFLEALERVVQCLECRYISHVFFPGYNLLRITEDHAINVTSRLRRFLNSLKRDFSNLNKELRLLD